MEDHKWIADGLEAFVEGRAPFPAKKVVRRPREIKVEIVPPVSMETMFQHFSTSLTDDGQTIDRCQSLLDALIPCLANGKKVDEATLVKDLSRAAYRYWCGLVPTSPLNVSGGVRCELPFMLFNHGGCITVTFRRKGQPAPLVATFPYTCPAVRPSKVAALGMVEESKKTKAKGKAESTTEEKVERKSAPAEEKEMEEEDEEENKVSASLELAKLAASKPDFPVHPKWVLNADFSSTGKPKLATKHPRTLLQVASPYLPDHAVLVLEYEATCTLQQLVEEKWEWDDRHPIPPQDSFCPATGALMRIGIQRVRVPTTGGPLAYFGNRCFGFHHFVICLPT